MQPVGERTRTAVTDKIGDQFIRFTAKLRSIVINTEFDTQHLTRQRGDVMDNDPFLLIGNNRNSYLRTFNIFVRNTTIGLRSNACQLRQRFVAVYHGFHQISGIIRIAERVQCIKHRAPRFIAQRIEITAGKTRARVCGVDGFCADLRHAHTVSGARHRQFSIDRITLTLGVLFIQ
ncbi:hypothetical protein D3C78_550350 [compost metagenome]